MEFYINSVDPFPMALQGALQCGLRLKVVFFHSKQTCFTFTISQQWPEHTLFSHNKQAHLPGFMRNKLQQELL